MGDKFFIIGSNSFTGATFVDFLLGQGAEVVGASRSPEPSAAFLPYRWRDTERAGGCFRFQKLDLNTDSDRLIQAIGEFAPDYVVNFAAQSMVAESWQFPDQWYETNVVANVKLHEGIRKFDFLKKYVHVSTPEVYGSCSGTVKENWDFRPSTPYAASRAACDLHLQTYFKQYNFPVVWTRAANVYGPGQQLYRIIPRTMLFILSGRKLQLHGGGHSVRSFIHGWDVADGTWRVARAGEPGDTYHLSTSVFVSIRELVEKICERLDARFADVVEVVGERPGKDAAYLLDSTHARETLGWKDSVTLAQGIEETVDWVRRNLDELKRQPANYIHKA